MATAFCARSEEIAAKCARLRLDRGLIEADLKISSEPYGTAELHGAM